jgi:hypothetical protein
MPTAYRYELWNGKKVVGVYTTFAPIIGEFLIVPWLSTYKAPYNKAFKEVTFKTIKCVVSDNHVDLVLRTRIDVRKKSKQQIALLTEGNR